MRINLFTNGDCLDINAWSSLPYFFYRNLQDQSIAVTPLNLVPAGQAYRRLRKFMALRARAIQCVRPSYSYELFRTRPYHALANHQLRSMARQHRDADLNVFLTYTFSSYRMADVPVVHFCDRTYEHHLEEIGRTPTANDRVFIEIDRQNIEHADLVLSTGQLALDFITSRYKPRRAFCLRSGTGTDLDVPDPDRLVADKQSSTDVLFIGRGAHKRGVDILIRSFTLFNARHQGAFTLHIVGVTRDELPEALRAPDPSIRFHGYLDRNVPTDRERYTQLLRSARLFVMPMRPGPFPGVIREAMLHCTPVIVSNVSGGPEILTHDHDGVLVDSLEPLAYAHQMDRLVEDQTLWQRLARNGHVARRNYTWADAVERFVDIVDECKLLKNGARAAGPIGRRRSVESSAPTATQG